MGCCNEVKEEGRDKEVVGDLIASTNVTKRLSLLTTGAGK